MKTILNNRTLAKEIGLSIHNWRIKYINGYYATNWSGENLSDDEFDKQYKDVNSNSWFVELDNENCTNQPFMELPDTWEFYHEENI